MTTLIIEATSANLARSAAYITSSDPAAGTYMVSTAARSGKLLFVYPVFQDVEIIPGLQMNVHEAAARGRALSHRLSDAADVEV